MLRSVSRASWVRVSTKIKIYRYVLTALAMLMGLALQSSPALAAAAVSISPGSLSIDEGNAQTVSVSLDAGTAITGPSGVELDFTSSDPGMASTSVSSLTFTDNTTPQNLTINTVHDNVY